MRPIATGYSHLVHGAELYLKKILEPLINKCTYLVDSQKAFKTRFLSEKTQFISNDHEIVTFDIKAMYPNINITKTINYIIATIFRAPQTYFKQEKDNKGYYLQIPTKLEFKSFLQGVLQDNNYFDCHIGVFKQL